MNKQLQADMAEVSNIGTNSEMDRLAIATLLARNERLVALLGCLVESITGETAGKEISPQLKGDIDLANKALDEFEENPLY